MTPLEASQACDTPGCKGRGVVSINSGLYCHPCGWKLYKRRAKAVVEGHGPNMAREGGESEDDNET